MTSRRLTEQGYRERIVDSQVLRYLNVFGALSIEGPKWAGKTWTSLNHASSVYYVGDPTNDFSNRRISRLSPKTALEGAVPHAIDEWQEAPGIWDAVRFEVDRGKGTGRFILTGSSVPADDQTIHSGAGRIARLAMKSMSLYESGESNGAVSLKELFYDDALEVVPSRLTLDDIVFYIVRGGWPNNLAQAGELARLVPLSYLDALVRKDLSRLDGITRNHTKVMALLRALARNTATLVSNSTLEKDIASASEKNANETSVRQTVGEYLEALKRLYVLEEIPAWTPELRAKIRLRSASKRLFVDPSLAAAALNADAIMLKRDFKTLGFMFENLCLRDLSIYAQAIEAHLFHYLDNSGLDIDAILELPGGEWVAIEVKLSPEHIDNAARKLLRLKDKITSAGNRPPLCLAVIIGLGAASHRRDDGVVVIPLDCLRP